MKSFIIFLVSIISISCVDLPSHAIKSIQMMNGQKIYFKREVRGINGNYDVIAISTDGNPCRSFDEKTDYCICNGSENVYYNNDDNTLILYDYSIPQRSPTNFDFPVKVESRNVSQIFTENTEKLYEQKGIKKISLELDKTIKCW